MYFKSLDSRQQQAWIPIDMESQEEQNYRLGMNFSYYDVLEVIESQLKSFGLRVEEISRITPILGEKIIK